MQRLAKHEGQPCPACGATLRDTGRNAGEWSAPFQEKLLLAVYSCEGTEHHEWTYEISDYRSESAAGQFELVRHQP